LPFWVQRHGTAYRLAGQECGAPREGILSGGWRWVVPASLPDSQGLGLSLHAQRENIKLALGRYPVVSLAGARRKAREEMERRTGGVDQRSSTRETGARAGGSAQRVELVARAWHKASEKDRQWSAGYAEKIIRYLELHVLP
jgi:hypothetical protein